MFELVDFNPQLLVAIVGTVLSVVFAKFPIVSTWYAALKSELKSLIMVGLLLLVSSVVYVLAANGVLQTTEPITIWLAVKIFVAAVVANQAIYSIVPESENITNIREHRVDFT